MRNKKFYPWLVVGFLWGVALLNYLDRQMITTMRPSMMKSFPELETAISFGKLMAIFLWVYALMSPVTGVIADRINRKWLIVVSMFVWSFVTVLMGFTTDFNHLFILRGIMGLSEAFYMPAALAMIADYHKGRTRSLAIGLHLSGEYLGQALGGFGSIVATNISWQNTFHLFGIIGVLYSIVLIIFLKEKRDDDDKTQIQNNLSSELRASFKGMVTLLKTPFFLIILFYFAIPSLPGWAARNWLPTLISNNLNLNMDVAGPIATITLSVASLIGVITGGFISDRWVHFNLKGRIYTGAIGLGLTVPSLIFIGLGDSAFFIVLGAIFFGLGFGIFDVNNMPILCQFASPRYRATGYGLMNLAGISAGAVVTELLGSAADAGDLGRSFALLSIVIIIAILVVIFTLKPKYINKVID